MPLSISLFFKLSLGFIAIYYTRIGKNGSNRLILTSHMNMTHDGLCSILVGNWYILLLILIYLCINFVGVGDDKVTISWFLMGIYVDSFLQLAFCSWFTQESWSVNTYFLKFSPFLLSKEQRGLWVLVGKIALYIWDRFCARPPPIHQFYIWLVKVFGLSCATTNYRIINALSSRTEATNACCALYV